MKNIEKSSRYPLRKAMIDLNKAQSRYYDCKFIAVNDGKRKQKGANRITSIWGGLRSRMERCGGAVQLQDNIYRLHKEWIDFASGLRILDFGCFDGNELSFWLAENADEYIGIDLSQMAVDSLNQDLQDRGIQNARAMKCDILDNPFEDRSFDLIYAQGVLHHFENFEELLVELSRLLKDDGIIVSIDAMMTDPLNRMFRWLYRPFQSNRDWEWPFTRSSFRMIRKCFVIDEMVGHFGIVKLGFPLMLVPGLRGLGLKLSRWGHAFDFAHARRFGIPFYLCWRVTMKISRLPR